MSRPSATSHGAARRAALRRVAAAVAVCVAVALGVAALLSADLSGAAGVLADADLDLLAVAAALYAVGQTVSGAMWAVCQRAGGVPVPLWTALGLHWVARGACEVLPASLGEAVRVGVVNRHPAAAGAGTWRIAGAVGSYKLLDAAVTGLTVLAVAVAVTLPGPLGGVRWAAAGALAAVAALALAWRLGAGQRLRRFTPRRARRAVRGLIRGAAAVRDPRAARPALALGAAAAALRIASLAALLAALGAPPSAALLAFAAIAVAGVVPGAPGGAGTREAALVPALAAAHGVPVATGLAFSVAVQAVALGVSLVAALAAAAWLGPVTLRRPDPVATVAEAPAEA